MSVESVKMSDTEEKLCFKFNYPKKFLCCISLETGALVLALITILASIVHIGVASYFISLGADVTNFGELVDGSKEEVYRITFSFYIFEKTAEDWEFRVKWNGGLVIAFSLLSLLLTIIGLVGLQKRKPILVYILGIGVSIFFTLILIFTILNPAFYSDDFTISTGLAWTLTIVASVIVFAINFYFSTCVHSLYLKLRKEEKEEQVRQKPSSCFTAREN